jgi:hypothetical protein
VHARPLHRLARKLLHTLVTRSLRRARIAQLPLPGGNRSFVAEDAVSDFDRPMTRRECEELAAEGNHDRVRAMARQLMHSMDELRALHRECVKAGCRICERVRILEASPQAS